MNTLDISNFSRTSNLEANDSLTIYKGHGAQQNLNAFKTFYNFLEIVKPKRIIEIGTGLGGFTYFLKDRINELGLDTEIRTYEVHKFSVQDVLIDFGIDARIENLFDQSYTKLISQEIIEYIQRPGISIVLCDGGFKIGEFNILSEFIKSGDFIMAHDYSCNAEYFKEYINRKLWNWMEIEDENIKNAVETFHLSPYMKDEFQEAVWVCMQKQEI